jgi:hypothetical protein
MGRGADDAYPALEKLTGVARRERAVMNASTINLPARGVPSRQESWRYVGLRLRVTRIARGVTERDAADTCGVTLTTYQRWEAGGEPRNWLRTLGSFAEKYDVSLAWLAFGAGTAPRLSGKIVILPAVRPWAAS